MNRLYFLSLIASMLFPVVAYVLHVLSQGDWFPDRFDQLKKYTKPVTGAISIVGAILLVEPIEQMIEKLPWFSEDGTIQSAPPSEELPPQAAVIPNDEVAPSPQIDSAPPPPDGSSRDGLLTPPREIAPKPAIGESKQPATRQASSSKSPVVQPSSSGGIRFDWSANAPTVGPSGGRYSDAKGCWREADGKPVYPDPKCN